ncbi:hypothetical protein FRC01_004836 [Tulasnella sp. 417]|nr:hypothetical protein FRC01_004836 [Tulasnella sp. 417]
MSVLAPVSGSRRGDFGMEGAKDVVLNDRDGFIVNGIEKDVWIFPRLLNAMQTLIVEKHGQIQFDMSSKSLPGPVAGDINIVFANSLPPVPEFTKSQL